MDAMVIFERYRNSNEEIQRIQNRIARHRDAIENITAHMNGTGGGSGSADMDKIGAFVANIDALNRELEKREMARNIEMAAALSMLDGMPELESGVLYDFYIKGMKQRAIGKKMGYTENYIWKIKKHGDVLLRRIPERNVLDALPGWYIKENP